MRFNSAGLSLDQAPPLSIPLRFFISAPIFALAALFILFWFGPAVFISRYHPALLACTHLLTLGFMTMMMIGALFQLMPVLAGSIISQQIYLAPLIHIGLSVGTLALASSFLLPLIVWWKWLSLTFLWTSLGIFLGISLLALFRAKSTHASVRYMRFALISLAATLTLGSFLELGHLNIVPLLRPSLTDLHLQWGFLGWISLLIIGVSLQVIPMFQVTPRYPPFLSKSLSSLILLALSATSVFIFMPLLFKTPFLFAYQDIVSLILICFITVYFATTLWLQRKRKRTKRDIFWGYGRLSFILGLLAIGSYVLRQSSDLYVRDDQGMILIGIFMICAVLAYINGMIYKIIPFLVWFNLQGQQMKAMMNNLPSPKVPLMHEIVKETYTWWQFTLYGIGTLLLSLSPYYVHLSSFSFYAAIVCLILSYAILLWQILGAAKLGLARVASSSEAAYKLHN